MLPKVIVDYKDGGMHPADLKPASSKALNVRERSVWFQPVRKRGVWFQPKVNFHTCKSTSPDHNHLMKHFWNGESNFVEAEYRVIGCMMTFNVYKHKKNSQPNQGPAYQERLVAMLYREVSADIKKDWGDGDVTLGLLKRLCLDNMEKAICLRLMMKETKVKIAEKNISIRRLRRNVAVGVNLLLEAALKYVGVCGFLDVAVIREYRGVACGLRIGIQKREESIKELTKTVRFIKELQADDMDSCNRTLSLIREVEVKAREKSRFILKLSGYEINALCARLTVIVDERVNFVDELDMLAQEFVPVKMAELMKKIHDKDIRNFMKLQILGREFELRAREKEIFIQKLKGNMDF
uniref:Uncharacterized protein n=1 Tax=Tanacetum cinerariifolium TaxID=118510 RepID=A0A699GPL6_TANCI|nr:hypothetical protein [Tanacetum cinerariifolium]